MALSSFARTMRQEATHPVEVTTTHGILSFPPEISLFDSIPPSFVIAIKPDLTLPRPWDAVKRDGCFQV